MNETANKPLTIIEAAAFLGLSKSYLYRLAEDSKIPSYKPTGGRVFFKRDDLERFIFQGRRSARYEIENRADLILNEGR
jgi:excisionase family DNA binding protein